MSRAWATMTTDAVVGWEWLAAPHVVCSLAVVCVGVGIEKEMNWLGNFKMDYIFSLSYLGGIFFFSRWAAYDEADMAGDVIDGDKGGAVASEAALLR